jgi:hypothetical protein
MAEKKRALAVNNKVLKMWGNRGISPAFLSWKEHSKVQKRLDSLGSKVQLDSATKLRTAHTFVPRIGHFWKRNIDSSGEVTFAVDRREGSAPLESAETPRLAREQGKG